MDSFRVLIVDERTAFQIIISHVCTYGGLLGSLWVNYHFLGASWFVEVFIILALIKILYAGLNKSVKRMTPIEAFNFLKDSQAIHVVQDHKFSPER